MENKNSDAATNTRSIWLSIQWLKIVDTKGQTGRIGQSFWQHVI